VKGKLVSYTTLPPSGKWRALGTNFIQFGQVQNSGIGESFARTIASRFGSAQQSSERERTHSNPVQSSFCFHFILFAEKKRLERVRWRTDVDVFVAESSEPGRHECVSWTWEAIDQARKKQGASSSAAEFSRLARVTATEN
jgi:hypothetical protein